MYKKIISAVLALSLVFVLAGCNKDKKNPEVSAINVEVYTVKEGDIDSAVDYTGDVKCVSTASVTAKSAGIVENVYVKVGDQVSAGQILMTVDDSAYCLQLQQAQASYSQAKAAYEQAQASYNNALASYENIKKGSTEQSKINMNQAVQNAQTAYDMALDDFNRHKALYEKGAISQVAFETKQSALKNAEVALETAKNSASVSNDVLNPQSVASAQSVVDQARAGIAQAQAGIEAARAAISIAEEAVENCIVKSPIDGYVSSKNVEVGQTASQGIDSFVIKDPKLVEVEIKVTEAVIGNVHIGSRADIDVASAQKTGISGQVQSMSKTKDDTTGLYSVRISLENEDDLIKDGMIANVSLVTASMSNVALIPQSALITEGEATYVYVAHDDRAVKKQIEIGLANEEEVAVLVGINEGEKVITEGKDFITENNNRIKIITKKKSTNNNSDIKSEDNKKAQEDIQQGEATTAKVKISTSK